MQVLEDRLNQLELGNHKPSPHMEYYVPENAYYMLHQTESGVPPTITPPPSHNQWKGQTAFNQKGQHPIKQVRNRSQRGGHQTVQFSHPLQCSKQKPSPSIPGTETHGRLGCLWSTPSRKKRRNRKHAGKPHQKNQAFPQSALLFYMWI